VDLLSPRPALGGKDSADLALAGVGRIAVVLFYRYVDDYPQIAEQLDHWER
jgi:hypothetical protein